MDKQVKTVTNQIRKISKERKELTMVKEERSQEVQSITVALKKLHLAQNAKERLWKEQLKRNEEDLEILKVKSDNEKAVFVDELKTLEGKIVQLDEAVTKVTDEMHNMDENVEVCDFKMASIIKETELAKGLYIDMIDRRNNIEKDLEMKSVMFSEKEQEVSSKVKDTVTCVAQEKQTLEEKEVCYNQTHAEIAELEKALKSVLEEIDKAGMKKLENEAKMLDNDQLAESYKMKIGVIEEMKGEMRVLSEDLKKSEEERHSAEEEYIILGEVEHKKEILEEANQKLSQEVHTYEANVQSCKSEVSLVQEEVKHMMKKVGLLESEVQTLEATLRSKNKQVQKDKTEAETRGKSVTGSKSSSAELKVKLETLDAELENRRSDIKVRKNRIENLKSNSKVKFENLKTTESKLAGINDINKTIDDELASAKNDVAAMTEGAKKHDDHIKSVKEDNGELEKYAENARDKMKVGKKELESLINESNALAKESRLLEMKSEKLGISNKQAKSEEEKLKMNIIQTEKDLELSLGKIESTDSLKNSIKEKNLEIKTLEKELKTVKRSQITANKRKEKLARQLEKNKLSLATLEGDIEKRHDTINMTKETIETLISRNSEIVEEKIAKDEALEVLRKAMDGAAAEAQRLSENVEDRKSDMDQTLLAEDKLVAELKKSAQEFEGLLVCKEREYSELKVKAANDVDSMEKRLFTLQNELEAILNPIKTSSDDETTSQENDLAEARTQTEVAKEELSLLKSKLAEKNTEVENLKLKLQTQKSCPDRTSRTPLGTVFPGSNATNKEKTSKTPQDTRKSRHLLSSGKTVHQSPVRSFLAPPSRNTPSSRHPRKKSSKKTTPPVIVDFDSIMGVSDDMDSN